MLQIETEVTFSTKKKKQNLCNGNQERVDSRGLKIFSLSHDRDMTKNIFHAEGYLI